ncbi:MAG TPA: ABC transporter substrate-binding protein, partial [Desulfovibrio sp.]|nr:ABC transporter substrate-binding protein [Desulfovibrio sp.]
MPPPLRLAVVLALLLTLSWRCEPAAARQDTPEVRLGLVATFSGEGFRAGRDA